MGSRGRRGRRGQAPGPCVARHDPQIAGAGATAPVAYRWKTQINENAKVPAFAGELPELDHNELVGWVGADGLGRFAAVFLDDADTHPRVKARIEMTRDMVAGGATGTYVAQSRGRTTIERLLSLVLLGDLVSLYLAVLGGTDPGPVEVIERIKEVLGAGGHARGVAGHPPGAAQSP